jgi:lipopolysaccharide heptosyltransferase II
MPALKDSIKRLLRSIGAQKVLALGRGVRCAFYFLLDLLGSIFFFPLFFFRKKAFSKEEIKKILVIRLDRIGDVILSTPALRALRQSFPEAKIDLLVQEYTKDLVVNNPDVDKVLVCGQDGLLSGYDAAIALHPGFRQNYLTFKSGAKVRVGYLGRGGTFFLTHKIKDDRAQRPRHEVESALEAVNVLGAKTDNREIEVSVTAKGEEFSGLFFKKNDLTGKGLIAIVHPGARQEYIRWRKEGFAQVCDRLIKEKQARVILLGSQQEKGLVEEIAALMKEKPLLATGLGLAQAVSLIKRGSLFIGNSTGTMHIAAALNLPVVAIFGSRHPLDSYTAWGPWTEKGIVVARDLQCPDCHPSDCRDFDCMKAVSSDDVWEAIKKIGI